MKVLVTGARGFVGRHLVAALSEARPQDALLTPTRRELDLGNQVSVGAYLSLHKPDLVFNLGAVTSPREAALDSEQAWAVNVVGTQALCAGLLTSSPSARLVHVSTCHAYGPPLRLPISEAHPLNPQGIYAESKAASEQQVREAVDQGLDAVIARPFNLTGPGQSTEYALADWCQQSIEGAHSILCGDIDVERDYMDVRDAASGLRLLAERGVSGEAYNLCSGRSLPLRYLLALVAPGAEPLEDPGRLRKRSVPVLRGSNRKAGALGWEPAISLEQSAVDLRLYLFSRTSI